MRIHRGDTKLVELQQTVIERLIQGAARLELQQRIETLVGSIGSCSKARTGWLPASDRSQVSLPETRAVHRRTGGPDGPPVRFCAGVDNLGGEWDNDRRGHAIICELSSSVNDWHI